MEEEDEFDWGGPNPKLSWFLIRLLFWSSMFVALGWVWFLAYKMATLEATVVYFWFN